MVDNTADEFQYDEDRDILGNIEPQPKVQVVGGGSKKMKKTIVVNERKPDPREEEKKIPIEDFPQLSKARPQTSKRDNDFNTAAWNLIQPGVKPEEKRQP
jgi:hypothetical protein